MTTTADLGGWCMARCKIEKDEAELTILESASDDSGANSLSIVSLDAIIALRDCIDEEIARLEQSLEIAEDLGRPL